MAHLRTVGPTGMRMSHPSFTEMAAFVDRSRQLQTRQAAAPGRTRPKRPLSLSSWLRLICH